jgi:hypothetical protein
MNEQEFKQGIEKWLRMNIEGSKGLNEGSWSRNEKIQSRKKDEWGKKDEKKHVHSKLTCQLIIVRQKASSGL